MRVPMLMVVVVVVVSAAVTIAQTAEEVKPNSSEDPVSPSVPILKSRGKFFFGSFSTTTYTQVVASTSTVFFSCLSGTASMSVCSGRGARHSKRIKKPELSIEDDPNM